jgi:hypothetical protein
MPYGSPAQPVVPYAGECTANVVLPTLLPLAAVVVLPAPFGPGNPVTRLSRHLLPRPFGPRKTTT